MSQVASNPAAPTLAAPEGAPPPSDPGSAKAALAKNTITPANLGSPATSDISPAPSHTPAPPPPGEAQAWTKDICEICWLPVEGKRPISLKKQKQKQKKRQQQHQQEQEQQQGKKKRWWSRKKDQSQRPEDAQEDKDEELEYWLQLPCKHRFGSECLKEWRKTEDEAAKNRPATMGQARNQCPTCKKAYLYHTCHRKAKWKVIRGLQAAKRVLTLAPPEICVKCELDAIDDTEEQKPPYWDYGFATLFVGMVMWAAIPHNQKHGYEPVTPKRQFVLRHLPKRWMGAMERTWNTKIVVGTEENPKAVDVQYTRLRRRRKMTRAEKKVLKKQRRLKRKMARNLIRKQGPGRQSSDDKTPAGHDGRDVPVTEDASASTTSTPSTTGATGAITNTSTATDIPNQTRQCGI